MMTPDFADADAVLEYAAQLVEEASFNDLAGVLAKKKRDREDAQLRFETRKEMRRECAAHIRAFKSRRDLDPVHVLRKLADLSDDFSHALHLRDAWPLAWKRWVNITCIVKCNSNSIPPETQYRIEITDEGREVLSRAHSATSDDKGE